MFFHQSTWLEGIWKRVIQGCISSNIFENRPTSLGEKEFCMDPNILKEFWWGNWEDVFCEVSSPLTHWLLRRRCWRTKGDHNNSPWAFVLRWTKNGIKTPSIKQILFQWCFFQSSATDVSTVVCIRKGLTPFPTYKHFLTHLHQTTFEIRVAIEEIVHINN